MSEARSPEDKASLLQWIQERKAKAQQLLIRSEDISHSLFSSGDLCKYFDLLSRLLHFDAVNLLLIYDKNPNASFLGSFNFWSKHVYPQGSQVLNQDGKGKGIDLIAPFTHENQKLVWYSVTVFDVTQTNANYSFRPSVYVYDNNHRLFLLDSIKSVLSSKYKFSVIEIFPTGVMLNSGLPGWISEEKIHAIYIRSDLSEIKQICWLSEVLISFLLQDNSEASCSQLFTQQLTSCISYCLFKLWSFPELLKPPSASDIPKEKHLHFLSLVQRTVRSIDELISAPYLDYLNDKPDDVDLDIMNLIL